MKSQKSSGAVCQEVVRSAILLKLSRGGLIHHTFQVVSGLETLQNAYVFLMVRDSVAPFVEFVYDFGDAGLVYMLC